MNSTKNSLKKRIKSYCQDPQLRNIFIIFLIGLVYWISMVVYMENTGTDVQFLRKMYIGNFCNGWCISHFFHYIVLSYVSPKFWYLLIVIGFLFELVETQLNSVSNFIDGKVLQDTLTNTFGIFVGLGIHKVFPTEIDLYNLKFKRI